MATCRPAAAPPAARSRPVSLALPLAALPLVALLLAAGGPVHAQLLKTVLYADTPSQFTWIFDWDSGFPSPGSPVTLNPTVAGSWDPVALLSPPGTPVNAEFGSLTLTAKHLKGPHVGIDVDPGTLVTFTFVPKFVPQGQKDFPPTGVPPASAGLGAQTVAHDPHQDSYTVSYQRYGTDQTLPTLPGRPASLLQANFLRITFQGQHVSNVPEPATPAFLACGVLGLAGLLRRARRSRSGV